MTVTNCHIHINRELKHCCKNLQTQQFGWNIESSDCLHSSAADWLVVSSLMSVRSGTFHRRRVFQRSTCWAREPKPAASSTEAPTPATPSGDSRWVTPCRKHTFYVQHQHRGLMWLFVCRRPQSTRRRWASSRRRRGNTSSTVWMTWCRWRGSCWSCSFKIQLWNT